MKLIPLTRSAARESYARGKLRVRALRRHTVSAVFIVDGERVSTRLAAKPPVGSRVDIGFPVIVVEAKSVAGGGVIVAAERLDNLPAD